MMRNSSAPRPRIPTLALTAVIIASGIIAALAALGCRGGGANPGDDDLVIPFVEPTLSDRTCLNDFYPPTAPTFDEVSETDFRPCVQTMSTTSFSKKAKANHPKSTGKSKPTTPAGSKTAVYSAQPTATTAQPDFSSHT